MAPERQLTRLARRFPKALVHDNPAAPGRGEYVSHSVVTEKLLAVVGPFTYQIQQIIRGRDKRNDQLGEIVVGCTASLTANVDGQWVTVEEVGDCENPANWPHDGARLKDASSDAIKRCAMRLGVGLHLWSQDEFSLDKQLAAQNETPDE